MLMLPLFHMPAPKRPAPKWPGTQTAAHNLRWRPNDGAQTVAPKRPDPFLVPLVINSITVSHVYFFVGKGSKVYSQTGWRATVGFPLDPQLFLTDVNKHHSLEKSPIVSYREGEGIRTWAQIVGGD